MRTGARSLVARFLSTERTLLDVVHPACISASPENKRPNLGTGANLPRHARNTRGIFNEERVFLVRPVKYWEGLEIAASLRASV